MGKDKDGESRNKRGKHWTEADSLELVNAYQHTMVRQTLQPFYH